MALDQSQYLHGMAEDENGRPIPKVKVSGMDSNSLQPVDIQSRLASTIQTHSGVVVGATTGTSDSVWIDCDGFDKVGLTFLNASAVPSSVDVYWSNDGTNIQGGDLGLMTGSNYIKSTLLDIKARYIKIRLNNTDASPRTMNAWAYLKA
jgi:hypothetical protein